MTPDNYALTELIPSFPSVMTCAEEDLENSRKDVITSAVTLPFVKKGSLHC